MLRLPAVIFILLAAAAALAAEPALRDQVTALFREQKWADAQALLEKAVAAEPENAEAYFFLGTTFLNRNDPEHALPALEKAVALAPTNSNYVRHAGDAYGMTAQKAGLFAKMGWARKCKAAYDKAVELDPNDINARWCVMEYSRQAPGFLGGGMDQAYVQAAAIKKLDPARGRTAYAELYLAEKKFPEAFAVYEEVLQASPDDYGTLLQIGRLAGVSGERLDQGLAALQHCLTLTPPADQPDHSRVHWRIGTILEKKGDQPGARTAYQAALAADPKFALAAESLARLK
jgi:tetratricopeptide (TPR) repeat protein